MMRGAARAGLLLSLLLTGWGVCQAAELMDDVPAAYAPVIRTTALATLTKRPEKRCWEEISSEIVEERIEGRKASWFARNWVPLTGILLGVAAGHHVGRLLAKDVSVTSLTTTTLTPSATLPARGIAVLPSRNVNALPARGGTVDVATTVTRLVSYNPKIVGGVTVAGAVVGGVAGPGAVAGGMIGGAIGDLLAPGKIPVALGMGLAGGMLGKTLFDALIGKLPDDEPDVVLKTERFHRPEQCQEVWVDRGSELFEAVYLYDGEERVATLPYDPGDLLPVSSSGWVILEEQQ